MFAEFRGSRLTCLPLWVLDPVHLSLVGPELGDLTMIANHRCLKSGERISLYGDRSRPGQALETLPSGLEVQSREGVAAAWSPGSGEMRP